MAQGHTRRLQAEEDARIRQDVCARLAASGAVDSSEVVVTVENGEVTLSGVVDDVRGKYIAGDIADSIVGVREVHDQIRVRIGAATEEREDDAGIAGAPLGAEAARAARSPS
jgi:osmotically-inducible protein OsmY